MIAMLNPEKDANFRARHQPQASRYAIKRAPSPDPAHASIRDFCFSYGPTQVLHGINLEIPKHRVTALIGPSGCGKSTLLRNINRMNDLIDGVSHTGDITIAERSIFEKGLNVIALRKRIGMVFQHPNPFPMSIYDNVIYPLKVAGERRKSVLDRTVEESLRGAALWDEVKDRLDTSGIALSGGQMQRLCIARAIANSPEILLMDEPCSALDPVATAKVEELIHSLSERFTIIIVTHNMQQAARVSDQTAFLYLGKLIEVGETQTLFMKPREEQTEAYISGRFG